MALSTRPPSPPKKKNQVSGHVMFLSNHLSGCAQGISLRNEQEFPDQ